MAAAAGRKRTIVLAGQLSAESILARRMIAALNTPFAARRTEQRLCRGVPTHGRSRGNLRRSDARARAHTPWDIPMLTLRRDCCGVRRSATGIAERDPARFAELTRSPSPLSARRPASLRIVASAARASIPTADSAADRAQPIAPHQTWSSRDVLISRCLISCAMARPRSSPSSAPALRAVTLTRRQDGGQRRLCIDVDKGESQ